MNSCEKASKVGPDLRAGRANSKMYAARSESGPYPHKRWREVHDTL